MKSALYTAPLFLLPLLVLPCLSFSAFAQQTASRDTVVLEGFISADRTLTPDKVYLVRYNVKVAKTANLIINAGTKVVFDPSTSIVLEGGLKMNGAPNSFIEFSSKNPNAPGNGINIRGNAGGDINIKYSYFKGLTLPLRFEPEWYRKNVTIEKNVFTELYSGESGVLITSPVADYHPGVDQTVNFSFSYNAFYKNWGSIFIENFEDNLMKLKFDNNLITNNVVYGIDIGIPSNTPVFGLFDDLGDEYKVEMQGNSIYGNYQINSATDTVIREISVGIQGDGQEFSIPNNFFRSKNADYISSTFDHFYQNSSLPLLKSEPFLTEPKEDAPPHIWKVKINGNEIQDYDKLPQNTEIRDVAFDVYFNKPVSAYEQSQLEAVSYDSIAGKILKAPVALSQGRWSGDKKVYSFVVSNASFLRDPYTFLVINHFKDAEGFVVPNFQIGQGRAINKFKGTGTTGVKSGDLINQRQGVINVDVDGTGFLPDEKSVKTIEALTDFGGLSALGPYRSLTKTWEAGLTLGVSNYFGSLTYKLVDGDDFHFAVGAFGQYNLNKWISFRAMLWYGRISGSDADEKDPDRRMRYLNFRNDILEGSLTLHWHLLKYGTSRGEKFTPTIFAGVSIFRNNPVGKIFLYERQADPGFGESYGDPVFLTYEDGQFLFDGSGEDVWVPLRPVGTEGQTQEFGTDPEADPLRNSPNASLFTDHQAPKQYAKVQVGFPFGLSLDYIVYNKWVFSLEMGVHVTTTKYLDDAGGYYWDRGSDYVIGNDGSAGLLLTPEGLPLNAHQSIINANPEIWAKVNGEKVVLPNVLTFRDPTTDSVRSYYTAALLANPSLVQVDNVDALNDPNRPNPNAGSNDAFTFNNAKKTNPKSHDHFAFIGLKVSKVIPNRKERLKAKKMKQKDAYKETKIKDDDKDGLSNEDEKLKGTNPKNYDTDGDLLSDGEEVNQFKSDPLKKDTDGDGLDDGREVRETETDPTLPDTDGDGLDDGHEVLVTKSNPTVADTDNGGIGDGEEVNTYKTNPLNPADDPVDSDGDGVLDSKDNCPKVAGLSKFSGCPDSDSDGIQDADDNCPYEAGVASNNGCPEVKPEVKMEEEKKEVEEDLQKLFKNIEFDTNKDVIRAVSYDDLNTASGILNEHTEFNVIIEGHTDNVGNDALNKSLSQKRADAVKKYLINKGISPSRIVAVGYGEEQPKESNDTESGRQANRRVEVKLIRPY